MKRHFIVALTAIVLVSKSNGAVTIMMNYDLGDNPYDEAGDSMVSAANQAIFDSATSFWESVITGYTDGGTRTLTIHASTFNQAGTMQGVLLGSAGPRTGFASGTGQTMTSAGSARFNVNPDAVGAAGLLDELTIRHEIGHVLGLGTLWELNGLYTANSGQYTGANALAAYNREFGQNRAFVPVELDGGGGTAGGHWNEVMDNPFSENQGGLDTDPGDEVAAPTVVSGINAGESLDDALMTGLLSGSGFLSDTTIGSLQDLGYTTTAFNVPELSSTFLLGVWSLVLFRRKR